MLKFYTLSIVAAFALVGCASTPNTSGESQQSSTMDKAMDGVGEAARAPLKDFNLSREDIPDLFKSIKNPYDIDPVIDCAEIAFKVEELNLLLGRDWDIPPPEDKALKDRAVDGASTAFLDALTSEATGLIPYRGVVRTVSGANRHQRKVRRAYERASHRRTFLKGIGLSKGCPAPASPLPIEETEPTIVYK